MMTHFLFSRGGGSDVVVEHSALSSSQKLSGMPTCIDVAKQPTFGGPLSPGDKPPASSLVPVPGDRILRRSTAPPPLPVQYSAHDHRPCPPLTAIGHVSLRAGTARPRSFPPIEGVEVGSRELRRRREPSRSGRLAAVAGQLADQRASADPIRPNAGVAVRVLPRRSARQGLCLGRARG